MDDVCAEFAEISEVHVCGGHVREARGQGKGGLARGSTGRILTPLAWGFLTGVSDGRALIDIHAIRSLGAARKKLGCAQREVERYPQQRGGLRSRRCILSLCCPGFDIIWRRYPHVFSLGMQ